MSKTLINFVHANGFPAGSYQTLFNYLPDHYQVIAHEKYGHNDKYPVENNWQPLVNELIAFVKQELKNTQQEQVISVGHSFGGVIAFIAACQQPQLFKGLIMLDPPVVTGGTAFAMKFLKKTRLIDKFSPAGKAKVRRTQWPLNTDMVKLFSSRQLFKNFDRRCLADYVADEASGVQDYMGAFAVSAGFGCDELVAEFDANHDDYNSILMKAVADRLAEAAAEYMHERVRKDYWGFAPEETLDNEALIRESYQGIRPAPGYPACPEHTEKGLLWDLLDVENNIGMELTSSYAMWPGAAVSGFYFAHPDSKYFAVAKIDHDQVTDYAERKGMTQQEAERWLSPNLDD